MQISESTSQKIRNMGLLCAVLVVFIHIPMQSIEVAPWVLRGYFSHGLGKIAVPTFFAIAGFLLAGHFDEPGWYRREVLKRVRSLVVPLILWCLILYAVPIVLGVVANLVAGRSLVANFEKPDLVQVLRIFAIYPFAQPSIGVLWFVRVLFILVVCSPLLIYLANPLGVIVLWLINGCIFPDYGVKCTPILFTFQEGFISIFGALWFCFGMMLRRRNISLELAPKIGLSCLLIGVVLLCLRGMPYQGWYSRFMTWLYIPFLMTGIWWICPSGKIPRWITNMSFPIYVLHVFFLGRVGIIARKAGLVWMAAGTCNLAGYVTIGLCAIIASMFSALVLRATMPKLAYILFGGR